MNTPYCIMKESAMPEGGKIASLSQEVVRRMQNTTEMLDQSERDTVINEYIKKLTFSGYGRKQVKEIIECGLRGYEKKLEKAKRAGCELHREACDTLKTRQKKKLLAKTTWYKKKKKVDEKEEKDSRRKPGTSQGKTTTTTPPPTVSVLFVPKTEGGELATRLRNEEEIISQITGDKIKIQERSGTMIKMIRHKSNPWSRDPCGRPDCLVCGGEEENAGECRKINVVYSTCCLKCKEKGKKRYYILWRNWEK